MINVPATPSVLRLPSLRPPLSPAGAWLLRHKRSDTTLVLEFFTLPPLYYAVHHNRYNATN